jgi:flagellar hook-associated protein 2
MFTITTSSSAQAGNHTVSINTLASPQSVLSNGFSSSNVSLNGGNAFNIQINSASSNIPTVVSVSAGSDTPQGIVDAINSSPNNNGINATLVNTGSTTNPYQIQLTGANGASNSFTISTDTSNSAPPLDALPSNASTSTVLSSSAFNLNLSINSGSSNLINIPTDSTTGEVTVGDAINAINSAVSSKGYTASLVNGQIQIADSSGNVQTTSMTSYLYDPTLSSAFTSSPASLNNSSSFSLAVTINGSTPVVANIGANASTNDVVSAIKTAISTSGNASISGDTVSMVNTGTTADPAYQIQIIDPSSGAAQPLTFSAYQASNSSSAAPSVSGTFTSNTASLNNTSAFNLNVSIAGQGSTTLQIPAGASISDVVSDLNTQFGSLSNSLSGDSATLVNTGTTNSPAYQIQITNGPNGSGQVQTAVMTSSVTPSIAGLNLMQSKVETASNASLTVDGVNYSRPSNTISDIIPGATLSLTGTTPASTPEMVTFTQNTAPIVTNINALVSAYNDSVTMLTDVTNPQSTLATYGATLVGNSTVRVIQSQLRDMVTNESSTPGTSIGSLWQMGITLTSTGTLSVNTTTLNSVLQSNYSDVVKTFTGNLDNSTSYGNTPGGIAGDAVKSLTSLLSSTGPIQTQTNDFNTDITTQQTNLANLQSRMAALLTQYTNQFAAMDSFVGEINSEKTSLTSTFAGMMAMYTNK